MKYKNAEQVLPEELIKIIQEYIQGEYIYIPVKHKSISKRPTNYKAELEKRNARIYTKHLEGVGNRGLAKGYHLSESSIRRIIIEQRKRYQDMEEKIGKILINWGMEGSDIKQIYGTVWQVEEKYVLKVYRNLDMLQRNLQILQTLGSLDVPVGKIIPTRNNQLYVSDGNLHYFLSNKLQGSNIVKIHEDTNIGLIMGEIIAELHIAFKICEKKEVFWNNSLLDEMNGWVKDGFEKNEWKYISKEQYEKTVLKLSTVYDELPVQLIHRDVHFGNFLFEGETFTGYIDFDLSQRNIRIFDLCYFVLGVLSEEIFKISEERWFEFVRDVFRGYENKQALSLKEKEAVPYVMECIELLFISYFIKCNDIHCAENAFKLFQLVRRQEDMVLKCMNY